MSGAHDILQQGGGEVFGCVRITVDVALGECKMVCDASGLRNRVSHLHSVDEIQNAYLAYLAFPRSEVSRDSAEALRWALREIRNHGEVRS